jgi:hypothetical protein
MADLLSYVASGIVFLAALIKLCAIRPASPTPAQRHLLIALVAFAPAHALAVPTTQLLTAPVDPFPYATNLASNALAMLAGHSLVAMLCHALGGHPAPSSPTRRRALTALLVIALVTMLGLLLASDVEFQGEFAATAAHHTSLVAYQVVFLAFMGFCAARFMLLLRQYLSRPDVEPVMRWGLRGVVLGAGVGLLWIAWAILTMATTYIDRPLVEHPAVVAEVVGAVCVTFMGLGSTLSAWGGWLQRTIHGWRVLGALRGITPLWRLVATVLPEIALHQATLTHPELLLYRRVIEIRDAQRRLLSYVPPGIDASVRLACAREHRLDTIAIRIEAAALVAAIDGYRAGRRQPAQPARVRDPDITQPTRLAEARWLIRVHAAMRYDRTVAWVVDQARCRQDPAHRAQQV